MIEDLYILILAGGDGKRLWPISNDYQPKQFIKFDKKYSLFQHSVLRALKLVETPNIAISISRKYINLCRKQLEDLDINIRRIEFIIEENPKNTGIIIGFYARLKLAINNCTVLSMNCDQIIKDEELFIKDIKHILSHNFYKKIFILGSIPGYISEDLGYILFGNNIEENICEVNYFIEKPKSEINIKKNNILSNLGVYIFDPCVLLENIKELNIDYYNHINNITYIRKDNFIIEVNYSTNIMPISIEKMIIEFSTNLLVYIMHNEFYDLGTWGNIENWQKDFLKESQIPFCAEHISNDSIKIFNTKNNIFQLSRNKYTLLLKRK